MEFTYESYKKLLLLLRSHGYEISNYHNWQDKTRCVILRHDIDNSIECALNLAKLEAECGVKSTYFVLVSSDFYNVFSMRNRQMLFEIQNLGHELGLHYDEMAYPEISGDFKKISESILQEICFLQNVTGFPVTVVSMHRPSKTILEADLHIPNVINTYSNVFFKQFKYLSDSRRRWREPATDIIQQEQYDRLQILVHAFWYHHTEKGLRETVSSYISGGNQMRYLTMKENISNLDSILENDV